MWSEDKTQGESRGPRPVCAVTTVPEGKWEPEPRLWKATGGGRLIQHCPFLARQPGCKGPRLLKLSPLAKSLPTRKAFVRTTGVASARAELRAKDV